MGLTGCHRRQNRTLLRARWFCLRFCRRRCATHAVVLFAAAQVCIGFLLSAVGVCLLFMTWNRFRGDFSLGILLVSCYIVFMGCAIAVDVTQSTYGIVYLN